MCFSATASFVVGAGLLTAGAVTLKKAKDPKLLPFAGVPFIFGIQQISEGFVWLSIQNDYFAQWKYPSVLIFLIFAQVVWPAHVPFSIRMMEEKQLRKTALSIITAIGIGVSVYLGISIFFFPIDANAKAFHIQYELSAQK